MGQSFKVPIGIAPMGYAGLFWPDAEILFARTARKFNVPYIMSGTSVRSIEAAAEEAGSNLWYQLYTTGDAKIDRDMISRAERAGCGALVITVDIPVAGKRERDIRNQVQIPPKMSLERLIDGLAHPRWTARYLASGGLPKMENWSPYLSKNASALDVAKFANERSYVPQTWDHLKDFRQWWAGALVVKGITHPDDAAKAKQAGLDGIIVSNHGGRQFDRAVSSLSCLPSLRAALGESYPIMFDGGIRWGSNVLALMCHGVQCAFVGRPFLYGASGLGQAGVDKALEILVDELSILMKQIGCASLASPDLQDFLAS
jgi:L-lactate dehydrogenase (cytochrome)/(S)-mandelate dehydrogenase